MSACAAEMLRPHVGVNGQYVERQPLAVVVMWHRYFFLADENSNAFAYTACGESVDFKQ